MDVSDHSVDGFGEDLGPEVYLLLVTVESAGSSGQKSYVFDEIVHSEIMQLF